MSSGYGISRPTPLRPARAEGPRRVGWGVHAVERAEELEAWRDSWDSLRVRSAHEAADFDHVLRAARMPGEGFALLIDGSLEDPRAMAAIRLETSAKRFKLGERLLGATIVRQAWLVGGHVVGHIDGPRLGALLAGARRCLRFDLLALPEIPVDCGTYQAARALGPGFSVSSPSRVDQIHWTIDLPETFESYLECLSSKTRQSVRYTLRKIAKELDATIESCHRPEQVAAFLEAGESISRQTYQWHVGHRLEHDSATLSSYRDHAEAGTLRAYLMRIEGRPVAFVRGYLDGPRFVYETPGYLAEYARWSIGTAMLMHTIRDRIESRDCEIFDFGGGGDLQGYKSRFGNQGTAVRALDIALWRCPRGCAVVAAQALLGALKNTAQFIVRDTALKRWLKAMLRHRSASQAQG